MSYPFFSGYGRDEAFPQDTDLSPVPFIIVRVLFAIPFAILFAKIISANGNANEFTLLAFTYSSVYHIIRFTIFRFQNFLFFN